MKELFKSVIIVFFSVFVGLIIGYFYFEFNYQNSSPVVLKTEKTYIGENTAIEAAVEEIEKSIAIARNNGKIGSGIILTNDGLAVFIASSINSSSSLNEIFVNSNLEKSQVLKKDTKESNLALVKIEKNNLSTIGFSDIENMKLGKRIFIISSALDKEDKATFSVNEGVIKLFNNELIETNIYDPLLVTGSPVFDVERKLIGLAQKNSQGFAVIIPVSKIRAFTGL